MSKRVRTLLVALVLSSVGVAVLCLLLPLACAPQAPYRVGGRAEVMDADWPPWRYDASRRAASPLDDLARWDEVMENIRRFTAGRTDFLNTVDLDLGY